MATIYFFFFQSFKSRGVSLTKDCREKVLRGKSGAEFCFLREEGKCPGWWSSTLLSKKQLCQCQLSTVQPAKITLPLGRKELIFLARLDSTFHSFEGESWGSIPSALWCAHEAVQQVISPMQLHWGPSLHKARQGAILSCLLFLSSLLTVSQIWALLESSWSCWAAADYCKPLENRSCIKSHIFLLAKELTSKQFRKLAFFSLQSFWI